MTEDYAKGFADAIEQCKRAASFILCDMRASGSWDAATMDRVIETVDNICADICALQPGQQP